METSVARSRIPLPRKSPTRDCDWGFLNRFALAEMGPDIPAHLSAKGADAAGAENSGVNPFVENLSPFPDVLRTTLRSTRAASASLIHVQPPPNKYAEINALGRPLSRSKPLRMLLEVLPTPAFTGCSSAGSRSPAEAASAQCSKSKHGVAIGKQDCTVLHRTPVEDHAVHVEIAVPPH